MNDVDVWKWDTPVVYITIIILIFTVLTLLILCIICRKSGTKPDVVLPPSQISCRYNEAFDYDEISASRIEERRCEREARLQCENPSADVTLDRIDRSIGAALAVEQLLRDSYIFDTHVMNPPPGDVLVVAAKRDYI
ncbi:hypothetical protein Y032_1063g3521 [Ancylostoma ceylanicum]|nr:hypothetical protein Y032_1063g3521 [Ancylostoma ceylanicum]